MALALDVSTLTGQLIVGGFSGATLTPSFASALAEGRRGGAILFRRNLPSIEAAAELCAAIVDAAPAELPPFVAVDQEGGRVKRLLAPALAVPPMRALAGAATPALVREVARAVGLELAAIGFNLDFAPILDVDTNPANPIIGDRAFGADPEVVARYALAFAAGLADAGVLACGKHFPGHGDTLLDSHLDLPFVAHPRARLDAVELPPFRAAARAAMPTLMTAHIVVEALDPDVPATLSRACCTGLLRDELGFQGVLFSDDLEMKAVAARWPVEHTAVEAIAAGCDALLICSDEDAQDRAHAALTARAEADGAFRARCEQALGRCLAARRACPPRPLRDRARLAEVVGGAESQRVARAIAAALGLPA